MNKTLGTAFAAVALTAQVVLAQPATAPASGAQNPAPAGVPATNTAAPRAGRGFGPAAADQPSPRTDRNSQLAHQQLVEKAKKGGIDIYFEGDSITRRWGTSDAAYKQMLANWNTNFFGWNAADFGWGADNLQNIIWRLENGELDSVNPKVIVFLGGINNINGPMNDAGVTNVTRGIKKILNLFQEKAPDAVIVLTAIFPAKENAGAVPTIYKIDEEISRFADGKKIRFLNVNDKFADKDGHIFPGMLVDGIHPTVKGYQVWADGLKPIFTEILGPPAKTDHAPPPSADPSATPPVAAPAN